MIQGHGGNKKELAGHLCCPVEDIIDMSSNLNPLGPPDNIHALILEKLGSIHSLPEPDAFAMRAGFARYYKIDPGQVIAGNGTTFFIYTIPKAIGAKRVVISGPTYSDYGDACAMHGIEALHCLAERSRNFQVDMGRLSDLAGSADLVFLCNPNNPTGALMPRDKIARLIEKHPNTCFVVDESYLPFVDDARNLSFVSDTRYSNLLVLSSMSKIFRIPGLRTGFLSGGKALINTVMGYYQPWSVNSLAQEVITDIFANPDAIEPFYEQTRNYIKTEKQIFVQALGQISGIRLFDAPPYFILAELEKMRAPEFCRAIGEDKILIRDCSNFIGLSDQFVRFSLKTREVNLALARSIQKVLAKKERHG
ncbi:MAG: aminotransferase class I/II-fold pyridoxal phosphate-dependent enzyme [Proteobacteria bacterium]|nr:aminotransferase class I/II-fold pyridoxal phosphate-dependent enzyme [Pseudomonadota bacterium]